MDTNVKNFCRPLTASEKRDLKKNGELPDLDFSAPFLAWSQKSKTTDRNAIQFVEVWEKSLFETPCGMYYAAIKAGIVIAVETINGIEGLFFFAPSEYPAALDFYNKMVEALKNNTGF